MKSRFRNMLALLTCMVMAMLALCAGTAWAEEEDTGFLGKPFPDFTVTDTDGNTFTLSEALKSHEAVLINLWATWCYPCLSEFPYLNEAFQKYGGRVAFIALSTEYNDTIEKIADYRSEIGISFPMGRDEGKELYGYMDAFGTPVSVIIDRFGNAVHFHDGAFKSAGEVERALEVFLGDGYTQSTVLERIPRDASTRAFPVFAARALYPDGDYRKILIQAEYLEKPSSCWIIPEEAVVIRAEPAAEDDVPAMMYGETYSGRNLYLRDMLDPETGIYACEQSMPGPEDEKQFVQIALFDENGDEDVSREDTSYLIRDEDGIELVAELLRSEGYGEVSWEYADEDAPDENALQAYVIHVVDQDNNPVEEVTVNFCTDTSCIPRESDETGTVIFDGPKGVYHVQIVDVPEGYSWDESYEMYTTEKYGEWVLRVRKD